MSKTCKPKKEKKEKKTTQITCDEVSRNVLMLFILFFLRRTFL